MRNGHFWILLVFLIPSPTFALSFDDRVEAQRVIERVRWEHRIWPDSNRQPKPELAGVLSEASLRAKVDGYLAKSSALETYWHRPVTAVELQAEVDRLARSSRAPEILEELFEALGNDPNLIAETLARQSLVERRIRAWYASDPGLHGALRRDVQTQLAELPSPGALRSLSDAVYSERTWRLGQPGADTRGETIELDEVEWRHQLGELHRLFGRTAGSSLEVGDLVGSLPTLRLSPLQEADDAFWAVMVLATGVGEVRLATARWSKIRFETWWQGARAAQGREPSRPHETFTLPAIRSSGGCEPDTWSRVTAIPDPSVAASAIWTGSEMIVWGRAAVGFDDNGARYDPLTDTWTAMSFANSPEPRTWSLAFWTGTEMLVWGGEGETYPLGTDGGRYDPLTDTWTAMSTVNAPVGRHSSAGVWTGSELIVWGGSDGGLQNTGGRYDPATDTWAPTSLVGAPNARYLHTAVWTGAEMVVWGGSAGGADFNTGGRYNPASDTWKATALLGAPPAREAHVAVWTGDEMLIWGGNGGYGGRYDPSTNSWSTILTTGAPLGRPFSSAVWTGAEMIVFGGGPRSSPSSSGGKYNPTSDTWMLTDTTQAPARRLFHSAVWTGSEMIVWGGRGFFFNDLNTGGRYDPVTNSWVPTAADTPQGASNHTATWTGSELIVWGGNDFFGSVPVAASFDPVVNAWTGLSSLGAPTDRSGHSAIWTGSELIVWGGDILATGGRYAPATDSWTPTSVANAPEARSEHTSVWTGEEMLVWGGLLDGGDHANSGSRYDPATDQWSGMSEIGAPAGRKEHTAVWTGSEMIVWGGGPGLSSGGRYDPVSDAWVATAPAGSGSRTDHSAVWTGSEMIVWGGQGTLGMGERYDPGSDTWTVTSASPIDGFSEHGAVWTGSEMIVWGGLFGTGARYDPAQDTWVAASDVLAPAGRFRHTASWTGSEMIVWGGRNDIATFLNTGGLYCVCPAEFLIYLDADDDGLGDPGDVVPTVACYVPPDRVENADDCDDANAGAGLPGMAEINDGLDNQCPGEAGFGIVDEVDGLGYRNAADRDELSWISQSGATEYEVARATSPQFDAGCIVLPLISDTTVVDPVLPVTNAIFFYIVRAADPNPGSWGQTSAALERTGSCL